MNGGLEQLFIDLEEALEDDNFHSEAHIIMLVHEKLADNIMLKIIDNSDGTHTIVEEKPEPVVISVEEEVGQVEENPLPEGIIKKTVYMMDYGTLEGIVERKFGVPYSFIAATESSNDVSHEFSVSANSDDGNDEAEKEILEEVEKVKTLIANKGSSYSRYELDYSAWDMLDYLCTKGIIPEGEYVIRVSY